MESDREINNKIILLRKSLKSILNQTKLNLSKKVKRSKELKKNTERKESELECFKRIKAATIPLSLAVHPDQLQKTITNSKSSEIERANARILLNGLIQRTLRDLKDKYGIERVEEFLKKNEKKLKKSETKRLDKIQESKQKPAKKEKHARVADDGTAVESSSNKKEAKKKKTKATKEDKKEESASEENEEQPTSTPSKFVDPFFIDASSGQNYLASITNTVSDDNQSESEETFSKKPMKRKMVKKPINNHQTKNRKGNDQRMPPIKHEKSAKATESKKQEEKGDEEKLHPSWQAKQLQMKKLQIQEFQGTKIKFDD